MPLSVAEKDHLFRLVAWARIAFALLAFVAAGESRSAGGFTGIFLLAYVLAALVFALVAQYWPRLRIRVPVWIDVIAMAVFLPFTASYVSFLMLFCFSAFAVATTANVEIIRGFVGLSVMAAAARLGLHNTWNRGSMIDFGVLMAGTAAAGAGAAWLGRRERQETDRRHLLEKISGEIQFERGLSESVQHGLSDLAQAFDCEQGCLAFLDDELERIFVWRVRPGEIPSSGPETLSLSRADSYLLDSLEVTTCWNSLEAHAEGFGWDRRTGQPVANPPRPPASMKDDLGVKSLLAATLQEADGRPNGRVMVFNRRHKFSRSDLRWFEHIVRHISPQIDNVYRMRHMRARAVEAERSRISRDLHDGILQTLLSLQIQLEVMRRNASNGGAHMSSDLGALQKTVRHEADELRRMVTEMRPLAGGERRSARADDGLRRTLSKRVEPGGGFVRGRQEFACSQPRLPRNFPDIQRVTQQHKKACSRQPRRGKTESGRIEVKFRHRRQRSGLQLFRAFFERGTGPAALGPYFN